MKKWSKRFILVALGIWVTCSLAGCIVTVAKISKATTAMNGQCTEPTYNHQYCSFSNPEPTRTWHDKLYDKIYTY